MPPGFSHLLNNFEQSSNWNSQEQASTTTAIKTTTITATATATTTKVSRLEKIRGESSSGKK